MVEIFLKNDAIRQGWYALDDSLVNNQDAQRWRSSNRPRVWRPPTDVYETEEAIVIRIEIGGMREEEISIYLDVHRLIINGNRTDIPERRAYYQMEIPYGEFSVEVELPVPVTAEGVEAVYREGILKIILPKARSHLIHVKEP
jgi:HSP20 family protein